MVGAILKSDSSESSLRVSSVTASRGIPLDARGSQGSAKDPHRTAVHGPAPGVEPQYLHEEEYTQPLMISSVHWNYSCRADVHSLGRRSESRQLWHLRAASLSMSANE